MLPKSPQIVAQSCVWISKKFCVFRKMSNLFEKRLIKNFHTGVCATLLAISFFALKGFGGGAGGHFCPKGPPCNSFILIGGNPTCGFPSFPCGEIHPFGRFRTIKEFRALRSARRATRPPLRRLLKKAGENFSKYCHR